MIDRQDRAAKQDQADQARPPAPAISPENLIAGTAAGQLARAAHWPPADPLTRDEFRRLLAAVWAYPDLREQLRLALFPPEPEPVKTRKKGGRR